jgi:TRAP-type transport system periplasmic protein
MCKGIKKTIIFTIIFLSITSIFAFSISAEQKVLKLGTENNIYSPVQMQAEKFKELVEKRTNGEIKVEIYPGGTLTKDPQELLEFLRDGIVDLCITGMVNSAGFLEDIQFFGLPFLFSSLEHHMEIGIESLPIKKISNAFEEKFNVKILGLGEDGVGSCITSKKPIYSFEDMKGLKIRCPMNPIFVKVYEAFGASPTAIDWSELYTSLQLGTVEAQDNSPVLSYAEGFFEVQDAVAITEHYWSPFLFLASSKTWNELTPEQQEIMEVTGKETSALQIQWMRLQNKEVLNKLEEEGSTVTYPDMDPFIKAAQPVLEELFKEYPHWEEWYNEIHALDPEKAEPEAGIKW